VSKSAQINARVYAQICFATTRDLAHNTLAKWSLRSAASVMCGAKVLFVIKNTT
jgi:hypothetical protein